MIMNNFVVLLDEAKQKKRLSQRGTSAFLDYCVTSLRKTRNYSPKQKNETIY